ncbi:MAG: cobalamin-independent methionine synthase II family protein [Lautropia sp.]
MSATHHRILTTHVGSLPRPDSLVPKLVSIDRGDARMTEAVATEIAAAVDDVVARQITAGVDLVSDGEMSKMSYTNYLKHRLTGFDGEGTPLNGAADLVANPAFAAFMQGNAQENPLAPPACNGPVAPRDDALLQADLANFRAALDRHPPVGAFMNAASPGVISMFMANRYYPDDDAYVEALADAMRGEYEAIVAAGFDLQIDAPDLAMGRHTGYRHLSLDEFKRVAHRNMLALNHATRGIDPARMRMHLCWGNYPGPHTHDVPIAEVFDIVMQARPNQLLFEAANPRHAHEHAVFAERAAEIPQDKLLIPGVLDTNTNCIEHPELIAERLLRFAAIVGRDRVIAGTDCGFSTVASRPRVFPTLVWQKLDAMREGARLASEKLWR